MSESESDDLCMIVFQTLEWIGKDPITIVPAQ